MSPPDDTRERIVRLEVTVETLGKEMSDTHTKVNEMHNLLMQARGARWAILVFVTFGGFVAGNLPWLFFHK